MPLSTNTQENGFELGYTDSSVDVIKVEKPQLNEDVDNLMKITIKRMLKAKHCTLTKVIQQFNEMYPDRRTSTQNFSNKLARDSIKFRELIEIANILGYELLLIPKDNESFRESELPSLPSLPKQQSQISNQVITQSAKQIKPIRAIPHATVTIYGSTRITKIIVNGDNAKQAANYLRKHLKPDMTIENEEVLCCSVLNHFNVEIVIEHNQI